MPYIYPVSVLISMHGRCGEESCIINDPTLGITIAVTYNVVYIPTTTHIQIKIIKVTVSMLISMHTAIPSPFLVAALGTLGTGDNHLISEGNL